MRSVYEASAERVEAVFDGAATARIYAVEYREVWKQRQRLNLVEGGIIGRTCRSRRDRMSVE